MGVLERFGEEGVISAVVATVYYLIGVTVERPLEAYIVAACRNRADSGSGSGASYNN